jgi:hypothetical protein
LRAMLLVAPRARRLPSMRACMDAASLLTPSSLFADRRRLTPASHTRTTPPQRHAQRAGGRELHGRDQLPHAAAQGACVQGGRSPPHVQAMHTLPVQLLPPARRQRAGAMVHHTLAYALSYPCAPTHTHAHTRCATTRTSLRGAPSSLPLTCPACSCSTPRASCQVRCSAAKRGCCGPPSLRRVQGPSSHVP